MNQPRSQCFSNMAAFRGGFENEDDEDSCMSCLDSTKYRCLRCKFPLCNKWSLPEENDEIPGWKAGKFVAYCAPCSKEAFEQGTQFSTHAVGGNAGKGMKPQKSLYPPLGKTCITFCLEVSEVELFVNFSHSD